ncbi:MAG: prepilin-type N-terminal cleavage/methylation domain-containing protein [Alphaproteobacteria bacterium]|nr:prepilin-type N-terminal cleavage/methylation domain-containing protein [Alphaproteobacteria bacterium]
MPTSRTSARRHRGRPRDAGFTLIELLVVLVVVALIAAVVAPPLSKATGLSRMSHERRAVVSALREARAQAIVTGRSVDFIAVDAARWRSGDSTHRLGGSLTMSLDVPPAGIDDDGLRFIRFFADGRSTGGLVQLRREDAARTVRVDWITGHVRQAQ